MPETFDFRALTLRQKAATSHEDLMNKFLRYRLMERGITRPLPYEPIPEPDKPDYKTTTRYELVCGSTNTGIVFKDPGALVKFLELEPISTENDWYLKHYTGDELNIVGWETEKDFTLRAVNTVSKEDSKRITTWGQERNKIREKNKEGEKEATNGLDDYNEAVSQLNDEWRSAGAQVAKHMQVIATFEEYKRMAGDENIARSFLEKAYSQATIEAALAFQAEDAKPGGAE